MIYKSTTKHFTPRVEHRSTHGASFGAKSGAYVLCLIVLLLLVREIYLTATLGNITQQHEGAWYPLSALPELLAVVLFAVPGLVPEKKDLVARANQREKDPERTEMV